MKKIILALSLIALTATTTFAGNDKKAAITPEQRVDYSIKQQLTVPNFLTETPGDYSAEIHFHVAADGNLIINDIISDNADLKSNLMYQCRSISVNTQGLDTESSYKMTVLFRVLEKN